MRDAIEIPKNYSGFVRFGDWLDLELWVDGVSYYSSLYINCSISQGSRFYVIPGAAGTLYKRSLPQAFWAYLYSKFKDHPVLGPLIVAEMLGAK